MGYPPEPGMGYPLTRSGWGTPQTWDGVPPQTWDWVPPWTWNQVPPPDQGPGPPLDLGPGTPPDLGLGNPLDLGLGTPPTLDLGPGTPPPTSTASTCYAAGGVPLAFTQEDFLVQSFFTLKVLDDKQRVSQWFFAGSRLVQILFCKEDYNISAFHCNV